MALRTCATFVVLLGLGACLAQGGDAPAGTGGWWQHCKTCWYWKLPKCWCGNDYDYKPLPPVACRYCPKGCDDYDYKPLPPVACRYCPKGCDEYLWKPFPCISPNWRPWYSCGAHRSGATSCQPPCNLGPRP